MSEKLLVIETKIFDKFGKVLKIIKKLKSKQKDKE